LSLPKVCPAYIKMDSTIFTAEGCLVPMNLNELIDDGGLGAARWRSLMTAHAYLCEAWGGRWLRRSHGCSRRRGWDFVLEKDTNSK
jgi:hypothetical protein